RAIQAEGSRPQRERTLGRNASDLRPVPDDRSRRPDVNKEHDLVCPNNRLGTVDVYLTTHHGLDQSGAPVIVHALHPRVAIMNNGAKKGGTPAAWQAVRSSPGLEDLWQLHFAVDGGPDHNVAETFIANMDETTSHGIRISASSDGSFTVTNGRNGLKKTYAATGR